MPEPIDTRRQVVVVTVAFLAAAFMLVVTLAAVPSTPLSAQAAPATQRLDPFFTQNWQLFAPSPLNADRIVRFQAAYRVGRDVRRTEWLDWTDVELDLVRRRLVGGRAGYLSTKLWALSLAAVARAGAVGRTALTTPARADQAVEVSTTSTRLDDRGVSRVDRRAAAAYDTAITTLASQALAARHRGLDLVAVRWQLASRPVVPYDLRHAASAQRRAARTEVVALTSGWRRPALAGRAADAAVADFARRHR